jgi:hypothetical protein
MLRDRLFLLSHVMRPWLHLLAVWALIFLVSGFVLPQSHILVRSGIACFFLFVPVLMQMQTLLNLALVPKLRGRFGRTRVLSIGETSPKRLRMALGKPDRDASVWLIYEPRHYAIDPVEAIADWFKPVAHLVVIQHSAQDTPPPDALRWRDVVAALPYPEAYYFESLEPVAALLRDKLQPGHVVIAMSEGDHATIATRLLDLLNRP